MGCAGLHIEDGVNARFVVQMVGIGVGAFERMVANLYAHNGNYRCQVLG
jgi:hypothetical protein